jgi:gallate 1-beta-glucosyltransferase
VAPGGSSDAHVQAFVDEVSRRACGVQVAKVVPPSSEELQQSPVRVQN